MVKQVSNRLPQRFDMYEAGHGRLNSVKKTGILLGLLTPPSRPIRLFRQSSRPSGFQEQRIKAKVAHHGIILYLDYSRELALTLI